MLDHDLASTTLRLAALPLLGGLAAVAVLRDRAARLRVRDDEEAAEWAVPWTRLSAEQRAVLAGWTDRDQAAI